MNNLVGDFNVSLPPSSADDWVVAWESSITPQEYEQKFAYIRYGTPVKQSKVPQRNESISHRGRKIKEIVNHSNSNPNTNVNPTEQLKPMKPNQEKSSKINNNNNQIKTKQWIDPLRVDYNKRILSISPRKPLDRKPISTERSKRPNLHTKVPMKPQMKLQQESFLRKKPAIPTTNKSPSAATSRAAKIMSTENGSNPLEYSKKFGNFGRKQKILNEHMKRQIPKILPSQIFDILNILYEITNEISNKIIELLIKLMNYSIENYFENCFENNIENNNNINENEIINENNNKNETENVIIEVINQFIIKSNNNNINNINNNTNNNEIFNENNEKNILLLSNNAKLLYELITILLIIPNISNNNNNNSMNHSNNNIINITNIKHLIKQLIWVMGCNSIIINDLNEQFQLLLNGYQLLIKQQIILLQNITNIQTNRSTIANNNNELLLLHNNINNIRNFYEKNIIENIIINKNNTENSNENSNENENEIYVKTGLLSSHPAGLQLEPINNEYYLLKPLNSIINTNNNLIVNNNNKKVKKSLRTH